MILIGIPVFNGAKYIRDCLKSVLTSENTELGIAVVVVDDASTDNTATIISKEFPPVKLISHNINRGVSICNNELLEQAMDYEYFMRLDVDTVVKPLAIKNLKQFLEDHSPVGLVSAEILTPKGQASTSYFNYFQSPITWFKEYNFLITKIFRLFVGRGIKPLPTEARALASTAIMACVTAIKDVGLFDENLPFFLEDSDWSKRFWDKGYEVYVVPDAKVLHFGGSSDDEVYIMCRDRSLKSLYRFTDKHYPGLVNRFLLLGSVLAGSALNLIVTVVVSLLILNPRARLIISKNFQSFSNVFKWHLAHLGLFLNHRV